MPDCSCTLAGCPGVTMEKLLRHAQMYAGSNDEVYDAAVDHGFEALDLGKLSLQLRQVDKSWKLAQAKKVTLAQRLLDLGVSHDRVCYSVGLSSRSLQSLLDSAERPVEAPLAPRKRGIRETEGKGHDPRCRACGATLSGRRMDARFCNASCRKSAFRSTGKTKTGPNSRSSRSI